MTSEEDHCDVNDYSKDEKDVAKNSSGSPEKIDAKGGKSEVVRPTKPTMSEEEAKKQYNAHMKAFKCKYECYSSGFIRDTPCGKVVDMTKTESAKMCALAGCGSVMCREQARAQCSMFKDEGCDAAAKCQKNHCDKSIDARPGATPGV